MTVNFVNRVIGVAICKDSNTNSLYATKNDSCSSPYTRFYSLQLNIFDAWWEYAGVDSISDPVNATQARKAITDAIYNECIYILVIYWFIINALYIQFLLLLEIHCNVNFKL